MDASRILGYALTLGAIGMVILGISDPEVVDQFKVYWMAAACAFVPGILLAVGKIAAATAVSRIVVGAIFMVSGLIKANDTVGFGIKLEEYFDENALGAFWANFHDFALPISMFVSGIEVLLGLALVFGARARLVAFTLLGMTLFFGWLTWFTAGCNDAQMAAMTAGTPFERTCVTDCGCFGDALRGSVGRSLTPWESFYKDLGLFFMVLVIVFRNRHISVNSLREDAFILPLTLLIILGFGGWLFGWMFPTWFFLVSVLVYFLIKSLRLKMVKYEWVLAASLALLTYGFTFYTYRHLPIKDFRPYAAGENIRNQMKGADELGLEPTIYATLYKLENAQTGEVMSMNSKEYLEKEIWKDENWKITYSSSEPIVIQRGYEAPIASFNILDNDGFDIGEELLSDQNYSFMVVMYDVPKAQTGPVLESLKALSANAEAAGHHFYVLTASPYEEYEAFRHDNQIAFPFYTGDEIMLKTIIRANPGLVLLQNGNVIKKWHGNDIPDFESVQKEYLNNPSN